MTGIPDLVLGLAIIGGITALVVGMALLLGRKEKQASSSQADALVYGVRRAS